MMGAVVLNGLRTRLVVRMLRTEPVLAVSASVTALEVAGYARQWCPDVDRIADTVVALADTFEVRGPVDYDEAVWRRAGLPPEFPHMYAVRLGPNGYSSSISDWTRYNLVTGLARKLRGRCRDRARNRWIEPYGEPPDPLVLAPRLLSAEDALRLLSPYLPGLHIGFRDGTEYGLGTDVAVMQIDVKTPSIFPLVRAQSWFTSARAVAEYEFGTDGTPPGRRQIDVAARALAATTDGVLLDEDGFPWQP